MKVMKRTIPLILCLLLMVAVAGCATYTAELYTSGGSKADALVELSHNWDILRYPKRPEVNLETALVTATEACKVWGYDGAIPFSGVKNTCNRNSILTGGCGEYLVTYTFQCTGK